MLKILPLKDQKNYLKAFRGFITYLKFIYKLVYSIENFCYKNGIELWNEKHLKIKMDPLKTTFAIIS